MSNRHADGVGGIHRGIDDAKEVLVVACACALLASGSITLDDNAAGSVLQQRELSETELVPTKIAGTRRSASSLHLGTFPRQLFRFGRVECRANAESEAFIDSAPGYPEHHSSQGERFPDVGIAW